MHAARLPEHHLTEEIILDYAAGAAAAPTELAVATHLVFCPACRARLGQAEALGGALLAELEAEPLAADALTKVLARLDVPASPPPVPPGPVGLPAPLRYLVDKPLAQLKWRPFMPGMWQYRLPMPSARGKARLLWIKPGSAMPQHTHDGGELTVVLHGSYTDELGAFRPGDIAITDETIDHRPVADPGEDCICLAVTEGPLRLTGPIGRLFDRFIPS